MKTAEKPRVIRVRQVSEMISMSRSGVYGLMEQGLLPYVKLGTKSRRVKVEDVEKLIESGTVAARS